MEPQTVINALIGAVGALFGWFIHTIWGEIKLQRLEHSGLSRRVQSVEVLVAGEYMKRSEFDSHITRLFAKLDSIESKVDGKADK